MTALKDTVAGNCTYRYLQNRVLMDRGEVTRRVDSCVMASQRAAGVHEQVWKDQVTLWKK